ncbi:phage head closure protein [Ornithinibacillus xuwenensis]|uniref:Phage head closure protein n=1 Tax=Ornithinibacillus xuwenensis TaxID=3144668 RepID=A0ABU9XEU2_9BACI
MRFDKQITLIKQEYGEDNIGNPIPVGEPLKRKVLAKEKSVTRNEFYSAGNTGLKPEIVFNMFRFEYEGDESIIFQNKEYKVIRSYVINSKEIELICEKVIGDG